MVQTLCTALCFLVTMWVVHSRHMYTEQWAGMFCLIVTATFFLQCSNCNVNHALSNCMLLFSTEARHVGVNRDRKGHRHNNTLLLRGAKNQRAPSVGFTFFFHYYCYLYFYLYYYNAENEERNSNSVPWNSPPFNAFPINYNDPPI
jgi:hypothetical protein